MKRILPGKQEQRTNQLLETVEAEHAAKMHIYKLKEVNPSAYWPYACISKLDNWNEIITFKVDRPSASNETSSV